MGCAWLGVCMCVFVCLCVCVHSIDGILSEVLDICTVIQSLMFAQRLCFLARNGPSFPWTPRKAANHSFGDWGPLNVGVFTAMDPNPQHTVRRVVAANCCETSHEANFLSYALPVATCSVLSTPARRLDPRMINLWKKTIYYVILGER